MLLVLAVVATSISAVQFHKQKRFQGKVMSVFLAIIKSF